MNSQCSGIAMVGETSYFCLKSKHHEGDCLFYIDGEKIRHLIDENHSLSAEGSKYRELLEDALQWLHPDAPGWIDEDIRVALRLTSDADHQNVD